MENEKIEPKTLDENVDTAWKYLQTDGPKPLGKQLFIRKTFIDYGKSIGESSKVSKKNEYYIHEDLNNLAFCNEKEAIFAASLKKFLPADTKQDVFQTIFTLVLKLGNIDSEWTFNHKSA